MSEEQSSYRQIMKATSIFGGVQVIQIIIKIIQSKIVAVLLGPSGMGIFSLLNSTLLLIEKLTNFGLKTSAVKSIAEANSSKSPERVSNITIVLRRWIWVTGIIGSIITIILSPSLSKLTFGNDKYSTAFAWLSICLLINQLSAGQLVILQGLRKIKYLANANLTGAILGLLITLPLYYFMRIDGIVPAIITISIANMLRSWYFANKVKIKKGKVSWHSTIEGGKEMLTMGLMISLNALMTTLAAYILRIFISNESGVEQVGLYSAGMVILETYVGMVFTAMGTDYFPRLSAVNKDNEKVKKIVTQQATIAILILIPLIIGFITFSPIAIQLLYSKKFLLIEKMITWGILGMLLRAASWSMGYIILARSDSKLFVLTGLGFSSLFLGTNILGYKIWGLTGIGIFFFVNYIIHFVALLFITNYKYNFKFEKELYKIMAWAIIFCSLAFFLSFINPIYKYVFGSITLILGSLFSLNELNKKLNFKNILIKK